MDNIYNTMTKWDVFLRQCICHMLDCSSPYCLYFCCSTVLYRIHTIYVGLLWQTLRYAWLCFVLLLTDAFLWFVRQH